MLSACWLSQARQSKFVTLVQLVRKPSCLTTWLRDLPMQRAKVSSLVLCSVDGAAEGAAMEAVVAVAPMAIQTVAINLRRTTNVDSTSSIIKLMASSKMMLRMMAKRTTKPRKSESRAQAEYPIQ